jgi:hypothetical protein
MSKIFTQFVLIKVESVGYSIDMKHTLGHRLFIGYFFDPSIFRSVSQRKIDRTELLTQQQSQLYVCVGQAKERRRKCGVKIDEIVHILFSALSNITFSRKQNVFLSFPFVRTLKAIEGNQRFLSWYFTTFPTWSKQVAILAIP